MRSAAASVSKLDNGRYRITIELPRDPKTGKRRRYSENIRGTRADAEARRAELLIRSGKLVRDPLPLDDFVARYYFPDIEKKLRKTTCYGYEQKYRLYIQGEIGRIDIHKITPMVVNTLLDGIDGQAKKFEAFKLLRQILGKAVRWDFIDDNPCSRVDVPKKEAYQPEVLTKEQMLQYIEAFRGSAVEAAVLIACGCGLRRSEIAALDWRDITESGTIIIDNAITTVAGAPNDAAPKTQFSRRTVHAPKSIMERLNELRGEPSDPVLMEYGKRMNPERITRHYGEVVKRLPEGLPRIPLKNLRHTSLTLALESGAELLAVSRRAGHSNVSITSAYYLRPHESIDKRTAEMMDSFLS